MNTKYKNLVCLHVVRFHEFFQDSPWIKYEKANKGRFTVGGMGKAFWFMTALFLKRYKLRPKVKRFHNILTS